MSGCVVPPAAEQQLIAVGDLRIDFIEQGRSAVDPVLHHRGIGQEGSHGGELHEGLLRHEVRPLGEGGRHRGHGAQQSGSGGPRGRPEPGLPAFTGVGLPRVLAKMIGTKNFRQYPPKTKLGQKCAKFINYVECSGGLFEIEKVSK